MWVSIMLAMALGAPATGSKATLIENGQFERGLAGWSDFWAREGAGAATPVAPGHAGEKALAIKYSGTADWSFQQSGTVAVEAGDLYELRCWARVEEGAATLCVTRFDLKGQEADWSFAAAALGVSKDWQEARSRFLIPADTSKIRVRLIGNGPGHLVVDDVALVKTGSVAQMRQGELAKSVSLANRLAELTFYPATATMEVKDRRTGQVWSQSPNDAVIVLAATKSNDGLRLRLLEPAEMLPVEVCIELDPDQAEIVVAMTGQGAMRRGLAFPAPFVSQAGTMLIMPVNEGISYPVDDASLPTMSYILYGGHGLCMAWYGVTDGQRGLMTLVETPDDATVRVPRIDGRLVLSPEWQPSRLEFGPERRLRYVLFDQGGYVAMAKRYRRYVQAKGQFKTLAQKRAENENVDRLVGAVNVWNWDAKPAEMCRQMQSLGIERILWSNATTPDELEKLNRMGVLTSRYDIYQDAMNPADFPKLNGRHRDWTSEAWPNGHIMLGSNGQWVRGWEVTGRDGRRYPCGVLCDSRAVEYAQRRIPPELETHPYRCRFIDTTTASSWRECYDPRHPMTRSESRRHKMDLLAYISQGCHLVCGSETGHDAAVPYVHYFEGMLSLGPYRVPDAGRRMQEIVTDVPERVAKFQTGHFYRLPLWELVYHDCVVSQWYWGDYNNKLPSLWDRRDLFNALYGTPPMFMFNQKLWAENRTRFVESYRTATAVARASGYREMLSHRWLTADHSVQQTLFEGDLTVTVNFGDQAYHMPDGTPLAPLGHRFENLQPQATAGP